MSPDGRRKCLGATAQVKRHCRKSCNYSTKQSETIQTYSQCQIPLTEFFHWESCIHSLYNVFNICRQLYNMYIIFQLFSTRVSFHTQTCQYTEHTPRFPSEIPNTASHSLVMCFMNVQIQSLIEFTTQRCAQGWLWKPFLTSVLLVCQHLHN